MVDILPLLLVMTEQFVFMAAQGVADLGVVAAEVEMVAKATTAASDVRTGSREMRERMEAAGMK